MYIYNNNKAFQVSLLVGQKFAIYLKDAILAWDLGFKLEFMYNVRGKIFHDLL